MKNLWSLQVGEAIVAEEMQKHLPKHFQVFIPLNNQLKNVDLIVSNLNSQKFLTLQVKESREYHKGKADGWFTIPKNKVMTKKNSVDFYVFLIYSAKPTKTKFVHHTDFIIVPASVLKKKSKNKKPTKKGILHYYFCVSGNNMAIESRESKKQPIDYSHYLNNFKQLK